MLSSFLHSSLFFLDLIICTNVFHFPLRKKREKKTKRKLKTIGICEVWGVWETRTKKFDGKADRRGENNISDQMGERINTAVILYPSNEGRQIQ